jgi:hypothetical protein
LNKRKESRPIGSEKWRGREWSTQEIPAGSKHTGEGEGGEEEKRRAERRGKVKISSRLVVECICEADIIPFSFFLFLLHSPFSKDKQSCLSQIQYYSSLLVRGSVCLIHPYN